MKKVTKEEFYEPIFRDRLNVHPRILGDKYPYTSIWHWPSNPHKAPYGRIVDRVENGLIVKDYYLEVP